MPQIIVRPGLDKLDGSLQKLAYKFLQKLTESDATPGLHIEPINNSVDRRARTGRVDQGYRAVLFKLQGSGTEASYVFAGVYPHDEAIAIAQKSRMNINPRNGIAELIAADQDDQAGITKSEQDRSPAPSVPPAPNRPIPTPDLELALSVERTLSLREREYTAEYLGDLGFDEAFAEGALDLVDTDEVLAYVSAAPAWQGNALLDLFVGESMDEVRNKYMLDSTLPEGETEDDRLLKAMQHPAAQMEFAFIDDDEALKAAIENPDFAAWRVFLHPEQRALTTRRFTGPARITGGAGTGKTVVLVHRTLHLARTNPDARIVLTTFNRTLADNLTDQLKSLDPGVPIAAELGASGIFIASVDQIAHRVIATAENLAGRDGAPGAVAQVLGPRTAQIRSTRSDGWRTAAQQAGDGLPKELTAPGFLEAEYAMVVLPNSLTTAAEYLKVRRPGRGVALNRVRRQGVWDVIAAYRASAAADASADYEEKAAIAARILVDQGPIVDHVLVDEAQDLSPSRFHLLRALVAPGGNDLFIAEDGHQRIYGQKLVLSHFDIKIRGRSARLTLNYRTTEQNLRFALRILEGQNFADLEGEPDSVAHYRSARRGPVPELVEAESLADEYARVAELVRTWVDDPHVANDSIGLLVATRKEAESLVRALGEHSVRVTFADRDGGTAAVTPQVMTMHRSKGMEFANVVLVGVGARNLPREYVINRLPDGERDDAIQRERSLLYVAATRARDQLVVMWTGDRSSLLNSVGPDDAPDSRPGPRR